MVIDDILRNELLRLRKRLREESRAKETPLVFSDRDLELLVKEKPDNKEKLQNVAKIDYRYQTDILSIITSLKNNSEDMLPLSDEVRNTLKELEKKLIEINKRNRMLYLPKLPIASFDLNKTSSDPFDLLFRHKIFRITSQMGDVYKIFNMVYRDYSKNYRDKGITDLYVGFPFIKGKMADDFYIQAPLALFPISMEKGIDYIRIKLDSAREVTYNSHLLLAYYKFHEINKSLPNVIIEDLNLANFYDNLIKFYEDEGIHFYSCHKENMPFISINKDSLKYYKVDDYSIESYAILARFSSYSTILQHDFRLMLDNNIITKNLNKLLASGNANFNTLVKCPLELDYVGELNSSQEEVIREINIKDAVVVEGPPGTGKSQTITSLVTNFVLNDKNVLLVSEKKAALDVVYSRLGILNKFALQIDDVNDKDGFYQSLNKIFTTDDLKNFNCEQAELINIDNEINTFIKRFKRINDTFYKENDFKVIPSEIYLETKGFNLNNPSDKISYNALVSTLKDYNFKDLKYPEIYDSYHKFSDIGFLNKVLIYKQYANSFISYLKEDLTELILIDVRKEGRELSNIINIYKDKIFKRKAKKAINNFAKKYFMINNHKIRKHILELGINISDLDDYLIYVDGKKMFNSLTKPNIYYLGALRLVIKDIEHDPLKANYKLLNYVLYNYITNYEKSHSEVLADIHNYNELYKALDNLYLKKQNIVLNLVYNKLKENVDYIRNSDKWDELNHNITSSKRKYNLDRFLNKYYNLFDKGIKIWLMTPEVVSNVFPLLEKNFDLVIFDEASQLYIEKSIPAIFRAKKLVVAGDSKQLRPSSLGSGRLDYEFDEYDDDNIALEEESLLELAKYKILPPLVLNFHYRSKYQELISFSNYAFYDDDLYISPNTCDKSNTAIKVYKLDNGLWLNRSNKEEALKVVQILKDLLFNRKYNETIGIITFNSQQRDLIEDLIDLESSKDANFASLVKAEFNRVKDGEDIGLFVKNIENVQGDERDIIIFSVGYAKNEAGKLVHNFGWLNQKGGENRLNVAITRAKQKVIIVTSISPYDLKIEQTTNLGPCLLKKYLEYCFAISNNDLKAAKACLYSLRSSNLIKTPKEDEIVAEVYQEIRRRGFTCFANIGVGKYSIALAIKQDDKYLLGIEFDTKLFRDIKNERERDYSRRKYMESRGWHIYRIWVMNWWRDKDKEIDNICKELANICKDNIYQMND